VDIKGAIGLAGYVWTQCVSLWMTLGEISFKHNLINCYESLCVLFQWVWENHICKREVGFDPPLCVCRGVSAKRVCLPYPQNQSGFGDDWLLAVRRDGFGSGGWGGRLRPVDAHDNALAGIQDGELTVWGLGLGSACCKYRQDQCQDENSNDCICGGNGS
jgi:hypothetical protein